MKKILWPTFSVLFLAVLFFVNFQYLKIEKKTTISAIIVPHHDLIKTEREKFFKKVAENVSPETIILVSPDHFLAGSTDISTTDKQWNLQNAVVNSDKEKISQLVNDNSGIKNDEIAFSREHGITNLLSEINVNFPNAKLIPLSLKPSLTKEKTEKLVDQLWQICPKNCLFISSVDFSHYQPGALAKIHDSLSLRALSNLDENLIWQAEVDSNQSLALAILWAEKSKTEKFHLEENTNSGKIANEPDSESTSYVFGWYEKGNREKPTDEVSFMIGGDAMFDRYVDYKFRGDKLVEVVQNLGDRFFRGVDSSIINLEGPISEEEILVDINSDNLVFNFPPKTPEVLKWLGVNAVSLANNHTGNAGVAGIENTQKVLDKAKISWIGGPSFQEENSLKRFGSSNKKLSVITLNNLSSSPDLTGLIKKEKENGNFVLIFPHWGNEYEKTHSGSQQNLAHEWIDAGADLVIGSHPHVIQDAELYKNKPIIYSLGNLVFDQLFSEETQQGLVVAGKISEEKTTLVFFPIVSKHLKPELMRADDKKAIVSRLKEGLGLDIAKSDYGYDIIEVNNK